MSRWLHKDTSGLSGSETPEGIAHGILINRQVDDEPVHVGFSRVPFALKIVEEKISLTHGSGAVYHLAGGVRNINKFIDARPRKT